MVALVAILAAVVAIAGLFSRGAAVTGKSAIGGAVTGAAGDRAILRAWAKVAEGIVQWPGLADFLDIWAQSESGWRLRPYGRAPTPGSNAAVGPYQLRPDSAGDGAEHRARFRANPALLEDPVVATAAIVDFLADVARGDSRETWESLRAAGAFPVFVHGRPTELSAGLATATGYDTLQQQQQRYDDALKTFRKLADARGHGDRWRRPMGAPGRRLSFDALVAELLARVGAS